MEGLYDSPHQGREREQYRPNPPQQQRQREMEKEWVNEYMKQQYENMRQERADWEWENEKKRRPELNYRSPRKKSSKVTKELLDKISVPKVSSTSFSSLPVGLACVAEKPVGCRDEVIHILASTSLQQQQLANQTMNAANSALQFQQLCNLAASSRSL
jgi:hypothetical protein